MRKLPAVEEAKAIMTEGMEWSMWRWLLEKKRVRGIADEARAALDEFEMKVKATWSDDLKIAYNQLVSENGDAKHARKNAKLRKKEAEPKRDSQIMAAVKRVKEADDEAYNAHEDAEDIFAEGEKRMSASMGDRFLSPAVFEAAIRTAEALVRSK